MTARIVTHDDPEATDALFDTSPRAMAARFGRRAAQQIRDGGDPYTAARLSASYAFLSQPDLRATAPDPARVPDLLFRLGMELNREVVERLARRRAALGPFAPSSRMVH